jgi:hypothetical protein
MCYQKDLNIQIEHLKNPDLMIREFSRLLKLKGKLYIEAPNARSILTPSLRSGMTWNFFDDPTHVRPYSKGSLCSLLKSNGFKIIRSGVYREWKYALALPIAPILSILLRDWRPLHYALIHSSLNDIKASYRKDDFSYRNQ